MRKIISILLAAAFVLCLSPQTVFAANETGGKTDLTLMYNPSTPGYTVEIIGLDATGSWKKGSPAGLTVTSNADFAKFQSVHMDGGTLDAANYTAVSGSTIITLPPPYLNTLALGKHTVALIFTDGSVEIEFTVLAADHTHTPGADWKKDADGHWKECTCGDKTSFAAHTPGDWIVDIPATATTDGSKHKECTVCGYVTETAVIPATGGGHTHTPGADWKKDVTGHWKECDCGDKTSFAAHTPGDWIIDLAATPTVDGSRHKECTVCGYVTETQVIPATGAGVIYTITGGANGSWKKGAATDIVITCNGGFDKFKGVKVNGVSIDAANYTAKSGSTIVTLKAAYLETLSAGAHTVELVFTDGSVQTGLTILAADNGTKDPDNTGGNDQSKPPVPSTPGNTVKKHGGKYIEYRGDGYAVGEWKWDGEQELWIFEEYPVPLAPGDPGLPQTGDNSNMTLWLLLFGTSMIGLGVLISKRKKYRGAE